MSSNQNNRSSDQPDVDVVVVGAGFAGMYGLHRFRKLGMRVKVFEAGSDVGGTWFWNRYPGARCDVESLEYSYGFSEELQQEWKWPERFSAQPDILKYLNHVADRFDLRRDIQMNTRVTEAHYDEEKNVWVVKTNRGDCVTARFFLVAAGNLSRVYQTLKVSIRFAASGTTQECGLMKRSTSPACGLALSEPALLGSNSSPL